MTKKVPFTDAASPPKSRASKSLNDDTRRKTKPRQDDIQVFMDTVQTLIVQLDTEGRITAVNARALRLLEYSREELLGRSWFETCLVQPQGEEQVRPVFLKMMAGEIASVEYFENFVVTKSGKQRLMAWHNAILRDGEENITGALSSGEDITDKRRTDEALAKNRALLEQTLEQSPIPMVLVEMPGAILKIVNSAYRKAMGIDQAPTNVGKSLAEIELTYRHYRADGTALSRDQLPVALALRGIPTDAMELCIVRQDSTERWMLASATPIINAKGDILAACLTMTDITERRQAEQERERMMGELNASLGTLRETEARLRALSDNIPDGMVYQIELNPETGERRLNYVSAGVENMHGVTVGDALSDASLVYNQILEEDFALLASREAYTMAHLSPLSAEVRLRQPSGQLFWRLFHSAPRALPNGRFVWDGIEIDITAQKLAEAALRESEHYLRTILDTTADGFVAVDPSIRIAEVNDAFCRMTGYSKGELTGMSIFDLDANFTREDIVGIMTSVGAGKAALFETRLRCKDNTFVDVEISTAPLTGNDGWTISFVRDLTERKRAQEKLRKSEENYRALFNEMLDGFALHEMLCDADGSVSDYRFLAVNPAFERMTGLKAEDIAGRKVLDIFPDTEPYWIETYGKVALTGEPAFFENYFAALGKYFEVTAFRPAPMQFAVIFADVTERRLAEITLKKERDRLSAVMETSPVGITLLDRSGTIIFANRQAEKILGLSREDISGQTYNAPLWRILTKNGEPMDDGELPFRRVMASGQPLFHARQTIETHPGRRVHLSINAAPLLDDRGEIEAVITSLEDISERVWAAQALREKDALLSNLAAQVPGMLFQFKRDPDGTYTVPYASQGIRALFGCTPEAVRDNFEPIFKTVLPEDHTRLQQTIEASAQTLSPWECEYRVQLPGGPVRWILGTSLPERQADGSIIWSGYDLDVTEAKLAAQALRESEEKFSRVFQKAPLLMSLSAVEDGKLLEINDAFTQISGYPREECLGKTTLEMGWISKEERDRLLSKLTPEQSIDGVEIEATAKDGWKLAMLVYGELINIGGAIRLLTLAQDMTERKQYEEEKQKLQAQLTQAQKMESVGQLAGGVAHDFNNMLGVIIGRAEIALEQMESPQTLHENLEEIHKAATRSADLTRQLLVFARKQTVSPRVLDLNATVSGMQKMIKRLIGENINLIWKPGMGLWPVRIDPSQIDQILANLCVNARDAISGVGNIIIETDNRVFDEDACEGLVDCEPGQYVMLFVRDTGSGMSAEALEHLFEPFFTTKGVGEGTGLGLAMVYGAVRQNRGFIHVQSEPGEGTTFRIYLPRHLARVEEHPRAPASTPASRGQETILLVEDELSILNMTRLMLEKLGYTVLPAKTPGEAMHLAREHSGRIHLLITDVIMPEMNGRDLAKSVLSLYPDIKRLFMSGYTADVITHSGVLEEGVHFLQKPFHSKALAAKVREALER